MKSEKETRDKVEELEIDLQEVGSSYRELKAMQEALEWVLDEGEI